MRKIYQFLTLAPSPLFLLGFLYSVFNTPSLCGAWPYEMATMWLIMFFAHLTPWFMFLQQLNLTRNT